MSTRAGSIPGVPEILSEGGVLVLQTTAEKAYNRTIDANRGLAPPLRAPEGIRNRRIQVVPDGGGTLDMWVGQYGVIEQVWYGDYQRQQQELEKSRAKDDDDQQVSSFWNDDAA